MEFGFFVVLSLYCGLSVNFLARCLPVATLTPLEPSHVNAHDAKLVPLFLTQLRSQHPIDPLKSLTTLQHLHKRHLLHNLRAMQKKST